MSEILDEILSIADGIDDTKAEGECLPYLFEGYRNHIMNRECRCPYRPGTMRYYAWCAGKAQAISDLEIGG